MIVAELPPGEIGRRLAGRGLRIRMGPIVASVRSPMAPVHTAIALHYAAHDVVDPKEFADFPVVVAPPPGLRRFIRPTVTFRFDDAPAFQPLPAEQAFALLEWGLNWCIATQCHQYLILHSAVVERDGRALILPAPPASGKSTLCAGLVARGWRLLSDEMALIDIETTNVTPIPRPISLKNNAIDVIRGYWPEAAMGAVVEKTLKGSVAHVRPPAASVARQHEAVSARWIVIPRYTSGAPTALAPLSRGAGFMQLVDCAFNYAMHGRRGFELLASVIDGAQCHRFTYGGDLDDAVRTFDALAGSS
ncbi:MAG: HprK-related kinase A [Casimicrobiaceae bacterium]